MHISNKSIVCILLSKQKQFEGVRGVELSSLVSLHFQGIFIIITNGYNLQLLKHMTKRLSMLNHTRKRILNVQSQLKETSKCSQINYLFLHLIYSQRCKQLQTEQTL